MSTIVDRSALEHESGWVRFDFSWNAKPEAAVIGDDDCEGPKRLELMDAVYPDGRITATQTIAMNHRIDMGVIDLALDPAKQKPNVPRSGCQQLFRRTGETALI